MTILIYIFQRVLKTESHFIFTLGLRFEEVTAECLLRLDLNGNILEGVEHHYNKTGYIIHGSVYKNRNNINAIFHVRTPEIVAVSSLKEGLQPLSQWALHFYNQIKYHSYDSLALAEQQGQGIVKDLYDKLVLLMRNHGALTCGETLQEAMFYTYYLQQACKTQE